MATLRRGVEFTHATTLDPAWKPGPGERYVDGPKARMVITRVTATAVYFGYAGQSRGHRWLARDTFEERYGAQIAADAS